MNYDEVDDGGLLTLISSRNRDALEMLYERYGGGVYPLAMHLLRESGAAEEVTQDVFFNVWRRASSYRADRGTVTAWPFSIAHHRAIDELRRRQTRILPGVDPAEMPSGEGSDPVNTRPYRTRRASLTTPCRTSGRSSARWCCWPTSRG